MKQSLIAFCVAVALTGCATPPSPATLSIVSQMATAAITAGFQAYYGQQVYEPGVR